MFLNTSHNLFPFYIKYNPTLNIVVKPLNLQGHAPNFLRHTYPICEFHHARIQGHCPNGG